MSGPARPLLWIFVILAILVIFGFLARSLIGCMMSVMLLLAWIDFSARRRRTAAQTLNSALRAVCQQEAAIGKVAVAFSRSGPLSGACYEYARRLMMGENPVVAAVICRIPLQLATAVLLESPADRRTDLKAVIRRNALPDEADSDQEVPVSAQLLYVTVAAFATCLTLIFVNLFVVPTFARLLDEFGLTSRAFDWVRVSPAVSILIASTLLLVAIVPLLNLISTLGVRTGWLAHWLPRVAERKAELLRGLGDGIEAGWPMGRALAVAHSISLRAGDRRTLEYAMQLIDRGAPAASAIRFANLIDRRDEAWLSDAPPERVAEVLRVIADQAEREAQLNLRWLMSILFPLTIVLLGLAVMLSVYGFLSALVSLTVGLT